MSSLDGFVSQLRDPAMPIHYMRLVRENNKLRKWKSLIIAAWKGSSYDPSDQTHNFNILGGVELLIFSIKKLPQSPDHTFDDFWRSLRPLYNILFGFNENSVNLILEMEILLGDAV